MPLEKLTAEQVAGKWKNYVTLEEGKIFVDWEKIAKDDGATLRDKYNGTLQERMIGDLMSCRHLHFIRPGDYTVLGDGLSFVTSNGGFTIGFQTLEETERYAQAFHGKAMYPIEIYQFVKRIEREKD